MLVEDVEVITLPDVAPLLVFIAVDVTCFSDDVLVRESPVLVAGTALLATSEVGTARMVVPTVLAMVVVVVVAAADRVVVEGAIAVLAVVVIGSACVSVELFCVFEVVAEVVELTACVVEVVAAGAGVVASVVVVVTVVSTTFAIVVSWLSHTLHSTERHECVM